MEAANKQSVKVTIMQREFTVACRKEETEGLIAAAAYLDKQMRAVAKGSQILGIDRCAVMAGLNIAHSLVQLQKAADIQANVDNRLQLLHDRVDKAVTRIKQDQNFGKKRNPHH